MNILFYKNLFRFKNTIMTWLLILWSFANAQKLPNKQSISIWAPLHVTIDGKINEWGHLNAYNKSTQIFYSLANDDKYLYLIVQAKETHVINKIYANGLTVMLTRAQSSKQDKPIKVTFPVFDKLQSFHAKLYNKSASAAETNLLMSETNKLFQSQAKSIKVSGINKLDSIVSIYNDNGILAQAQFDYRLFYTCEVAISLEKLHAVIDPMGNFNYTILLHPLNLKTQDDNIILETTISPAGHIIKTYHAQGNAPDISVLRILASETSFHGEYTLAKKP